jgi:hypothetical protein
METNLDVMVRYYFRGYRQKWPVYEAIRKTARRFDMTDDQVKGIVHLS